MPQVEAQHYGFTNYMSSARWSSFWKQAYEVLKLLPESVLEIGPGAGVAKKILVQEILSVKTMDIAADLKPDIIGSITNIPLADDSVDVVLCAEVMEHLPFDEFESALHEINRVCRIGAVISLPHWGRFLKVGFTVPKFGFVKFGIPAQLGSEQHSFDGEHYWEIGKAGYHPRKIRYCLEKYFIVEQDERLWENPYHHFYRLRKRQLN